MRATGSFEVKLTPLPLEDKQQSPSLGRMGITKRFSGGLEGSGSGEMLTAMGSEKGSAVYVAVERFDGALDGRPGSFVLHHTGVMTRGAQSLSIRVAPDSGTGALAGLTGTLTLDLSGGAHKYVLDYELPAKGE
jgi:hypothetical protein